MISFLDILTWSRVYGVLILDSDDSSSQTVSSAFYEETMSKQAVAVLSHISRERAKPAYLFHSLL